MPNCARQAELSHRILTHAGYDPIGFDHYALAHDPLSLAARHGRLRRNFQGFTDDNSEVLIGLAPARSANSRTLVQNEKERRPLSDQDDRRVAVSGSRVSRTAEDCHRGRVIEQLLCDGGEIGDLFEPELLGKLRPFLERGLATIEGHRLGSRLWKTLRRVIASLFDTHRQPASRRFSSAI
jgi:oxygen-independent coproporphyrinogen-3 oxidase